MKNEIYDIIPLLAVTFQWKNNFFATAAWEKNVAALKLAVDMKKNSAMWKKN
jgi:hypothetical protein